MWTAAVLHRPAGLFPARLTAYTTQKLLPKPRLLATTSPLINFKVSAAKKPTELPELVNRKTEGENVFLEEERNGEGDDVGWLPAFPHVLVASMSNFLFGFHIGVINGPIISIANELGFSGNSILEGLVVSIFIAGAFLGSISSGSIVDKLGFWRTLQVDTIPLILGATLSAQAHSLEELLLGRFLVGLGIGVNTVLVPIYISEVAPTKYRGSLGSLCQIGTCTGIIASLFLGISSENDPHWWRTMLYIAGVPGFILTFGMQFAVESPRWLCKAGRLDAAKDVISNLWGPSEVDGAIQEFQSVLRNDGGDLDSRWSELLEEPHSRVAFVGGALFVLQQFAGINGVLYFSSLTFKDVGITNSALASLCIGITNFAGALGDLYLIDRQGRQRLLIGSYLGMAISMFLVVSAIILPMNKELSHSLSILGTILYIFTFAIGAGPANGLIIPELSSSRTRSKIMGFSFSIHWLLFFLLPLFTCMFIGPVPRPWECCDDFMPSRDGQDLFKATIIMGVSSIFASLFKSPYWVYLFAEFCLLRLPLSQAVILSFTTPIVASVAATFILHEKLKVAEIAGIAFSFFGLIFIFRLINVVYTFVLFHFDLTFRINFSKVLQTERNFY